MSESFNRNQYIALISAAFLSPALRLYPRLSAQLAGGAAWLSPGAAFIVMALYAAMLCAFMEKRHDGEGLAQLIKRVCGRYIGSLILCLSGLWLILYCGFTLRSGADRFVTTVYPSSAPTVFCVTLGLLALVAALGSVTALVRTAKLILPMVFGVLLLALVFSLRSVQTDNLSASVFPAVRGAFPAVNVLSSVLVYPAFLISGMKKEPHAARRYVLWLAMMCAVLSLLSVTAVGSFGAELTERLEHPFFSMVRNFVIIKSVERIEALVVGLWVFPDFLLTSLLLMASVRCLLSAFGKSGEYGGQSFFDFSGGRRVIWLCGAAAVTLSLVIAPNAQALALWSQRIIPMANMIYVFGLIPLICIAGRVRSAGH